MKSNIKTSDKGDNFESQSDTPAGFIHQDKSVKEAPNTFQNDELDI